MEKKLKLEKESFKFSELDRELFNPVEESIGGAQTFIPNPLSKLRRVFNFHKEQYILIGSNTGSGKTSILDHFILSIIRDLPKNLHFEVLYYSMERKKKFKYAKWISWHLKDVENKRVSVDTILNRDGRLKKPQLDEIKTKHKPWLENVMSHIDLREGRKTVEEIKFDIDTMAKRLGTHFSSDSFQIYKDGKIVGKFNKEKFIDTKYGRKLFTTFVFDGKDYVLYQNDSMYITKKPTIVFIVLDHIGKIPIIKSKKDTLDNLDDVLSSARDKYSFSPVPISQFNRSVGNVERLKLRKGDLSPTLEDFKDTGNLSESADLVLSIFDPARYKAWNSDGEYNGINIEEDTITPTGQQRARAFFVLKNSFGMADNLAMLRFTGESGYFESMPNSDDVLKVNMMYNEISKE